MKMFLNPICEKCADLGIGCEGTQEQVWTGCIYRKVRPDDVNSNTWNAAFVEAREEDD